MASITLKGREIPLLYTVYEMKLVQEEIAPLSDFQYVIFGRNREDPNDNSKYASAEHLSSLAKLIRILGNAGLEEAGENPDLTDKKILRGMRPQQLVGAVNACIDAINEGMESEYKRDEPEGPVDVTLEDMKKKKARDD